MAARAKVREERRKEISVPKRFVARFWEDQDGRTIAVREIRRRLEELERDCGAESYQQRSLCQRAIFLELQLESMEIAGSQGKEFDAGVYTQAANALSGLLTKLGLKRHAPQALTVKAVTEKYRSKERA